MLAPLLRPRTVAGLRLDVHLRENDHVHAYCGLTRVVDASLVGGRVRLDAADTYRNAPCAAGLFRDWTLNDPAFDPALENYLTNVTPGSSWTSREGTVQALWSAIETPWRPLDREAVLGYVDKGAQVSARTVHKVEAARREIEALQRSEAWAALSEGGRGAELDQLAIDPEGRLVLIELKYAPASPASVFYAPFQLLQYVHEWHQAFDAVRGGLDALREARIALGLSPARMAPLKGGLRPVLAFGEDPCSPEVERRLDRVRAIVDRHLPPGVPPIEVWALRSGAPQRLR